MTTWDDIIKLGRVNPIVHACLYAYNRLPGINRQECLMEMVRHLAERNNALDAELADHIARNSVRVCGFMAKKEDTSGEKAASDAAQSSAK